MKKLKLVFAALLAALGMIGCAARDAEPPSVTPDKVREAPPTPPTSPDGTDPR